MLLIVIYMVIIILSQVFLYLHKTNCLLLLKGHHVMYERVTERQLNAHLH